MDKSRLKLLSVIVCIVEIILLFFIFGYILYNDLPLWENICFVVIIIVSVILYRVIINLIFNFLRKGERI
ncbi:hypothetical protein CLLU_15630 [Clostridium luticellarii]|jgi:hypothetical protein|uniref:Uncharacterized protein n=1 Tax=Clostridium luticellarii TaxID=1691940 RepID=A0A2T0BNQ5_9CLOT|nr:hypothetical protein CLLU_15630 [Clostridium luticellarii]